MKQTLSDKFFNWFGSVKEWFQNIFERDDNFNDDKSFVGWGFIIMYFRKNKFGMTDSAFYQQLLGIKLYWWQVLLLEFMR